MRNRWWPAAGLTLAALLLAPHLRAETKPQAGARPAAIDPAVYGELKFRHIGPAGNRVSAVAGVPGAPQVYYAGAASGGIFKTTDGGIHWEPVFDAQPVMSIGALAVAPSDPNVVWAGTGEPWIRSNISLGWGVFRSTDAGKTWTRAGLEKTGRIAKLVVDPRNPDLALACALGHAYGPQPDRGVFRTTDGGRTWERVLFVDENTGCSDLAADPNNPRILFAGTWQVEIHTWGRESGGPGSGLYRSADGGVTWKPVEGNGLPSRPYGKVGLALSKADSSRVYALIETGDGAPWRGKDTAGGRLWRSDDGGLHWSMVNADRQLAGRTHYYNRLEASPDNADEVYFLTAAWAKTLDGGKTIVDVPAAEAPGGDHHDIWIDPADGSRLAVAHDGGISVSGNRGRSWLQVQLPIAQMYHVTVDDRVPYFVYGNMQDGPSTRGPSDSRLGNPENQPGIPRGLWSSVGGGESGWATPDPVDSNVVWSSASGSGSVGGIVTRYDLRTNTARSVEVWPQATTGWPAADLRYRFVWTFPLTISPHDHERVYVGSQHLHVTTDRGQSWSVISPDLTRNDKSRQQPSGGLTPDNIGVEYAGVVFAIAESPVKAGVLWAGTNDGLLHVSQDAGGSWTNVTAGLPGMPAWGTVSHVEPSHFDAGTAYVVVDAHQVDDRDAHVYRTADYGRSWKAITGGLPRSPLAYAHVLREDPVRRGLLFLGTEGGLFVSLDDGGQWLPLQNNLPRAPVYGLAVQPRFADLVVGTYGRGFWILDDITVLRQLAAEPALARARLFVPRPAYRLRSVEAPNSVAYDPTAGWNPPYGASIHYWLEAAVKEKDEESRQEKDGQEKGGQEKEQIKVTIADASGKVVRTFKGPARAGINHAYWDLEYDKTKEARLRTSPRYAPAVKVGPEGIKAPGVGRFGLLAPPGTYTVKLKVGELELSQPLTLLKDPEVGGSEEDLRAQAALVQDLADDVNRVVEMIDTAEAVRGQLAALAPSLRGEGGSKELAAAGGDLDGRFLALEEELFQTRVTGRGQDVLRWPAKLVEQLLYLAHSVSGSDFAPTASQRAVHELLHPLVAKRRAELDQLLGAELAHFNGSLAEKKLTGILARP